MKKLRQVPELWWSIYGQEYIDLAEMRAATLKPMNK